MSDFIIPLGSPDGMAAFAALDTFTQGYTRAMFFTEERDLTVGDEGPLFEDLAEATLARIVSDCNLFQAVNAESLAATGAGPGGARAAWAGRDFWLTRNGHGAGFWDGGWDEPAAAALTSAAHGFGDTDLYWGDDGELYLTRKS